MEDMIGDKILHPKPI